MLVGPEMSKTSLFCHSLELKNHLIHKHWNTCHEFNFHHKLIFVTMSSIRINNNWNYQNLLITAVRSPLGDRPLLKSFFKLFIWEKKELKKNLLACVPIQSFFETFSENVKYAFWGSCRKPISSHNFTDKTNLMFYFIYHMTRRTALHTIFRISQ